MNDDVFSIDEFLLCNGEKLTPARVAYRTYGTLNRDKTNVILLCSPIASGLDRYEFLIGEGKSLDPTKYFIVSTALFGSGISSSPSNSALPGNGMPFPPASIADNVTAQKILLDETWGISNIRAVCGFSMGAQQAFQWAVSYPTNVEKVIAGLGHARTTPHTEVFLDGIVAALKASPDWREGNYEKPPRRALKAASRAYAAWATSAAWYRAEGWRAFGCETKEQFLEGVLDEFFYAVDANDYLFQVDMWKRNNVGLGGKFNGDHLAALATVTASVLVLPCVSDLYFPVEDSVLECSVIPNASLVPIESNWGHWVFAGMDAQDREFINGAISTHLSN